MTTLYCSSYCNKAHRTTDGKPVQHECRILPIRALQAEMAGDFELAQRLLQEAPARYMRRGTRE